MRVQWIGVLIGVVALGAPRAAAAPHRYRIATNESSLRFTGEVPWHRFIGVTAGLQGRMGFDPEHQRMTVPGEVTIPVASFETGNRARDRDMREMFEAATFPQIRFTLVQLDALGPAGDGVDTPKRYRLSGRLQIRQVVQPVTVDVLARVSDTTLDVWGETQLMTTAFDLHPPALLGLFRVRPQVRVEFTTRWQTE